MTAGLRYTYWTDSLRLKSDEPDPDSDSTFRGEGLERVLPTASVGIVGPSFSRIFEGGGKSFSRFKHVMEPRLSYLFRPGFDEQNRIARFDEIDRTPSDNAARISFVNRLLAKPAGEGSGAAREIMSLEIFQFYSFDDERPLQESSDGTRMTAEGPLSLLFRFMPNPNLVLRTEARYNTLFSGLESTATSGTFALGPHRLGLRWTQRLAPESGETRTDQVRASTSLRLHRKLRLTTAINYDIKESFLQDQRYIFEFAGSCYGLRFELSQFETRDGSVQENEFRFAVSLKNVGTFFDLTGGTTESL